MLNATELNFIASELEALQGLDLVYKAKHGNRALLHICDDWEQLPDIEVIYDQYAAAMSRRRPDSVLEEESFEYYLNHSNVRLFVFKESYIIGQYDIETDTFKVSHFAPKNTRQGVEAIKALQAVAFNVVFAVTDDLASMLERCDYTYVTSVPMVFRDELVTKLVYVNNDDAYDIVIEFIRQCSF